MGNKYLGNQTVKVATKGWEMGSKLFAEALLPS
jgi:hypothetical protein